MKSEGVKDIVKWLEGECRLAKESVERARKKKGSFFIDNEYGNWLDAQFEQQEAILRELVRVKSSVEKYMKKLQHQGE